MTSVARRVVDRQILHLLKMWLEAPVDETDDQGRTRRTTRSRDSKRGIPQGAPISPLLSNLYMRRLVLGWKRLGFERRFGARIVSYADDLVICCRYQAEEALAALRQVATRIGLTVNEDKTHVCRLPQGRFDFLGYSFERCYSEKTGRSYLGSRPSKKSIQPWSRRSVRKPSLELETGQWSGYLGIGNRKGRQQTSLPPVATAPLLGLYQQ